ncbi:hypothetical protein LPTSP4_15680 [Leptospira ryugenii]|uniref:DUF2779 domain-containing protein n=1 Tax=Leptospira ryugenii TaxID=1917863 RepID=A0A2P2DZJ8_9LEPT|nr:DUF2779 domain-containing protein [Leptospira ryugenii]GBF50047.1 hypothetical protein LPTSP4_15680 [Leptospira ryugenii]
MQSKPIQFPINKSSYLQFSHCANSFYLRNQNLVEKNQNTFSGSLEWKEFQNICLSQFESVRIINPELSKPQQIEETKKGILERVPVSGGQLLFGQMICFTEFLYPDENGISWTLYDFRPVSSHKLDILRSLFFQNKILSLLAIPISDTKLIKINPSYILEGNFNAKEYLSVESVADRLKREEERFELEWKDFQSFVEQHDFSFPIQGYKHCNSPKSCIASNQCYPQEKNFEIFDLREAHDLGPKFFQAGFRFLKDLPEEELNPIQRIQVTAHRNEEVYFDLGALSKFLETDSDLVAFLDFETINPAIPIFEGTKPFQHCPFLYSIHIWDQNSESPIHHSYIHHPENGDPRKIVLQKLFEDLPKEATVYCFNDFFEKQVIENLVEQHPENRTEWHIRRENFKDLAKPFKHFWIYSPKQKGKASLKEILPAFFDISHESLSIKLGQDANYQYLRLLKKQVTEDEKLRVLEDLENYCKMDSYALFLLYQMIRQKIG